MLRPLWLLLCTGALVLAGCTSSARSHEVTAATDRADTTGTSLSDDERQRCVEDALRSEADALPALGRVVGGASIASDSSEHDAVVEAIAAAIGECWDIDELRDLVMATAAQQLGIDAATADCVGDGLGSRWFAERAADAMVHGGEIDDSYEGIQLAAVMRCSTTLTDQLERAGYPEAFVRCNLAAQDELVAQLEQTPARWRELTSEGANTARALGCQRELPPISPRGSTTFAESTAVFPAALAEEVRGATGDALGPAVATCLSAAVVGGLGDEQLRVADPTAAELAAYVRGVYRPEDLRLEVSALLGGQIAEAAVECAGTQLAFVLILTPGEVLDALGRPDNRSDLGAVVSCTLGRLDEAVLRSYFAVQLVEGPAARTAAAGERLIDHTFGTIAACADELGIPHGTPAN